MPATSSPLPMSPSAFDLLPPNPLLYQVNTRVLLSELGAGLGRPATLLDVPDTFLEDIAGIGADWVWLLGVWQTGEAGRAVSASNPRWVTEHRAALPDLTDADVTGSPFAIVAYDVHTDFGGDAALADLRTRLASRGLRLMLDLVPNHTAPDHPWITSHPHRYVHGTPGDLEAQPQNWFTAPGGPDAPALIIAHGRDPYFDGWPDTAQLNYRHPDLRAAMQAEIGRIAQRCDGVRCDMAMLLEPEVFTRTWGEASLPADGAAPVDEPFWPQAIAATRAAHPDFTFMAEVYWDMELQLQQHGFDLTYDKRLYDRLRDGQTEAIRDHLRADPDFQHRSARFLENHDEPRAAATFPPDVHEAAAVVAFLAPGLRFLHEGQLVGRRQKAPLHLRRRPTEVPDRRIAAFYDRLLAVLRLPVVRDGDWTLLDCRPAWAGNPTDGDFLAYWWAGGGGAASSSSSVAALVVVNYADTQAQCRVDLSAHLPAGAAIDLVDHMHDGVAYRRETAEILRDGGLFIDLPAWGYCVFEVAAVEVGAGAMPTTPAWQIVGGCIYP